MNILRIGVAIGVIVATSACGSSDETATTEAPGTSVPASTTVSVPTTEPAPTTAPSTTTTVTTTVTTTTTTATPASTAAPTTPATTAAPTTPAPTTAPPTVATDPPRQTAVKVYFLRDERLVIAHRTVTGPAILRAALDELLAGPTADELAAGLHSEVPAGSTLRDVNLSDGLVTADLSGEFESGGGTASMSARLAQVIFTATQFDNTDAVLFWIDGAPVEFFGGEGIELAEPRARMHAEWALTLGIIFSTPAPGSTVTSPFTVTGEGDVFEGDFPMEVRRDGRRVGDVIVVGAGAWGTWDDFEATIDVDLPPGPIEVVATSDFGCTPDSEPNCPVDDETVLPLILAD